MIDTYENRLPFPTLLNEQSFVGFASRSAFVDAMRNLGSVVKAMRSFGYAMQLECSRTLMDVHCFGNMTFRQWLFTKDVEPIKEREIQRLFQQLLNKVPRFEERYEHLLSDNDFDLYWQDKIIYLNKDRTIPAFLISVYFKLPSLALPTGVFAGSHSHVVEKQYLTDDATLRKAPVEVEALATLRDVEDVNSVLRSSLVAAVLDGSTLLKHSAEFLADISFSDEVRASIARLDLRAYPVVSALVEIQKRFQHVDYDAREFWNKYRSLSTYAEDESETTHNKHPGSRTFTWSAVKRDCWAHIKLGSEFRIHFVLSSDDKKIYVGHVGHHLPT